MEINCQLSCLTSEMKLKVSLLKVDKQFFYKTVDTIFLTIMVSNHQ